jgi:hypothetical protein
MLNLVFWVLTQVGLNEQVPNNSLVNHRHPQVISGVISFLFVGYTHCNLFTCVTGLNLDNLFFNNWAAKGEK